MDVSSSLGSDMSDDIDSEPEVEQPPSIDLGIAKEAVKGCFPSTFPSSSYQEFEVNALLNRQGGQ